MQKTGFTAKIRYRLCPLPLIGIGLQLLCCFVFKEAAWLFFLALSFGSQALLTESAGIGKPAAKTLAGCG